MLRASRARRRLAMRCGRSTRRPPPQDRFLCRVFEEVVADLVPSKKRSFSGTCENVAGVCHRLRASNKATPRWPVGGDRNGFEGLEGYSTLGLAGRHGRKSWSVFFGMSKRPSQIAFPSRGDGGRFYGWSTMNWLKRCSPSYGTARNPKRCGPEPAISLGPDS